MYCINKNHPEFLELLNKAGDIHKDILAAKVSIWQEKNNEYDRFPNLNELDLNNISYQVRDIYGNIFNTNTIITKNTEFGDLIYTYNSDNNLVIVKSYSENNNYINIIENQLNNLPENSITKEQINEIINYSKQFEKPILVFKGLDGKRTASGKLISVHNIENAIWGSQSYKDSLTYARITNRVAIFVVEGNNNETVKAPANTGFSTIRKVEEDLINNSKADIVFLDTKDGTTKDKHVVIKYKPESLGILNLNFPLKLNIPNKYNQNINNKVDTSNINPLYSAVFINTENLTSKYPQVHQNLYSHHSTIEFKPKDISNLEIGKQTALKITGRLTTDNLDVLIVDNPLSKNQYPHITLSTAKGIAPVQSNSEIANNLDKIQPLDDYIIGTIGVFDNNTKTEFTGFENYQEDTSFRDDDGNLIESTNYVNSTFDSNNTMFDKSIKTINKEIEKLNKDLENSNNNIKSIINDSIVKQGIDPNQIKNEQRNEYSKLSSNMQKLGYKPLTENSFLKITSSAVEANNIGFDEDSYNYYNSPSKEITINSNGKYNVKVTYNAATSADNIKELKQQGIIEYDNNEIKKDIEEDEFLIALINNHFEGLLDSEKEIIKQKIKLGEYQIGCKL